ncbi:MAG: leucyl aminopeptidase [Gemmatimonadetes bacterium]|nr:leucyl aminopeptidase [Gemmatimonadota bacterium]
MSLSVSLHDAESAILNAPLAALALGPDTRLGPVGTALDKALGGVIARAIADREFRGARDEVLHLTGGERGARRVLLVGIGTPAQKVMAYRRAGALAARRAKGLGAAALAFHAPGITVGNELEAMVAGLMAGPWEYADLKTPVPEAERRAPLEKLMVVVGDARKAKAAFDAGVALGEGQAIARTLAMMPGNLCTPQHLADTAKAIGKRHDLPVTVLGRKELEQLGCGSFLSVAQGTPQDPKLVVIEYMKGKKTQKPIALVGKGVCFDSGGISIKPAPGMEFMKFDMSGAAGVLGAMETIARLKLKVNVVGLLGATTNMPSGTAINPGDVVKSMIGKSIEITNTDAEGRLILADVLGYAHRYQPSVIIDAATLTGACVIALGHHATGAFGNDERVLNEVIAAGKRGAEQAWPLPLWDDYKEQISSDVADLKNTGGRPAGSVTAALFLREFIPADTPWVHLDIAGTAYSESDLVALPKGPTGIPVGTFVHFVRGRAS